MSQYQTPIVEQEDFEMLEKAMDAELKELETAAEEIEALGKKIDESMSLLEDLFRQSRELDSESAEDAAS